MSIERCFSCHRDLPSALQIQLAAGHAIRCPGCLRVNLAPSDPCSQTCQDTCQQVCQLGCEMECQTTCEHSCQASHQIDPQTDDPYLREALEFINAADHALTTPMAPYTNHLSTEPSPEAIRHYNEVTEPALIAKAKAGASYKPTPTIKAPLPTTEPSHANLTDFLIPGLIFLMGACILVAAIIWALSKVY